MYQVIDSPKYPIKTSAKHYCTALTRGRALYLAYINRRQHVKALPDKLKAKIWHYDAWMGEFKLSAETMLDCLDHYKCPASWLNPRMSMSYLYSLGVHTWIGIVRRDFARYAIKCEWKNPKPSYDEIITEILEFYNWTMVKT